MRSSAKSRATTAAKSRSASPAAQPTKPQRPTCCCRIRTGYGPENTSRLRRFAISVLNLHARPGDSIASMTRRLAAKSRQVFDYLLMTRNSNGHAAVA